MMFLFSSATMYNSYAELSSGNFENKTNLIEAQPLQPAALRVCLLMLNILLSCPLFLLELGLYRPDSFMYKCRSRIITTDMIESLCQDNRALGITVGISGQGGEVNVELGKRLRFGTNISLGSAP